MPCEKKIDDHPFLHQGKKIQGEGRSPTTFSHFGLRFRHFPRKCGNHRKSENGFWAAQKSGKISSLMTNLSGVKFLWCGGLETNQTVRLAHHPRRQTDFIVSIKIILYGCNWHVVPASLEMIDLVAVHIFCLFIHFLPYIFISAFFLQWCFCHIQ